MRSDVKILLEKLGKGQFRYKEFLDRFSDLDTWPVFEAVIRDPRILNSEPDSQHLTPQKQTSIAASMGSVFSEKYSAPEARHVQKGAKRPDADVRALLAQISYAADKGAI